MTQDFKEGYLLLYKLFFYKHTGKLGWSSIRFSQFEPEILVDGTLNFKTHSWSHTAFNMNPAMISLTFEILWLA